MSKSRPILALVGLLGVLTIGATAATQQSVLRLNEQQITQLATRLTTAADAFRRTLDLSMAQGSVTPSRYEDNLNVLATDFSDAAWHLRDHATRRQVITTDVEDVLNRASRLERAMDAQRPSTQVTTSWRAVRRELDQLARSYDPPWDWNNPRTNPAPESATLYHRLTGTYQLEPGRSDNPQRVVDQAVRSLPAAQRDRVTRNFLNRLEAPEVISIDRNQRRVTIASSNGPQVSFDATGEPQTETTANGRTMTTRADLSGDALVVSTLGSGGSDFNVSFEPLDAGRSLQVTRRLYTANVTQPVTVRSVYRKVSDQPQWDVNTRETSNLVIVDGTQIVARLDQPLNARTARDGDLISLTVTSPAQYEGATIEGTVARLNNTSSAGAGLILDFDTIQMRNSTRASRFVGILQSARTPDGKTIRIDNENAVRSLDQSQTNTAIERGAIGAAVGAIIGALAGGGKGAAIGAAIGASGGAGTVLLDGQTQIELPRGTELTIVARTPRTPAAR